jgi:hypothetical protein
MVGEEAEVLCFEPAGVCNADIVVDANFTAPLGVEIQEPRQAAHAPFVQHSNCLQKALELPSGRPV